jgi:hypothetical protein
MKQIFTDYSTYPEKGKLKQDPNGILFRVFPDGTWSEEVK